MTGSCHCVVVGGKTFLVDCGMEQGKDIFVNQPLPVKASEIDYVFLTHAHIDHSGMLPKLYIDGFRGKIFSTEATAELCAIMLKDSAHIQEVEAEWKNRKRRRAGQPDVQPEYTTEDAEATVKLFSSCHYDDILEVAPGIKARFSDVGHMLGSACIEFWLTENGTEKKIVFSGDVGNLNQPIVRDPSLVEEADYIVVESTYGSRYHAISKFDYATELAKIIKETFDRGGNVVIPSFAVGRTQEMLYFLREVKEQNLVPEYSDFEVIIDSPMAIETTEIFYLNSLECYDEKTMELVQKGVNPISFPGLKVSRTAEESKLINMDLKSKVILASSGMCEGGRIRHHLKHNLWRADSTILFVGYQSVGTLGRLIADGIDEVNLFGEKIKVAAKVSILAGVSGHADRAGLMRWIDGFKTKPQQVFVVHGEDESCTDFARFVTEQFGYEADAPYSGSIYDLAEGKWELQAEPELSEKAKKGAVAASEAFAYLEKVGRRVLALIASFKGRSNGMIRALGRDLEKVCEKHEKD